MLIKIYCLIYQKKGSVWLGFWGGKEIFFFTIYPEHPRVEKLLLASFSISLPCTLTSGHLNPLTLPRTHMPGHSLFPLSSSTELSLIQPESLTLATLLQMYLFIHLDLFSPLPQYLSGCYLFLNYNALPIKVALFYLDKDKFLLIFA